MTEHRRNQIAFLLFREKMKEDGTQQFISNEQDLLLRQADKIMVTETEMREFLTTTAMTVHDTISLPSNMVATLCR